MLVRHDDKSKLDAVEVVIRIDLPIFVRFALSPTLPTNNSLRPSSLYSNNHAEFTVYTLIRPIEYKYLVCLFVYLFFVMFSFFLEVQQPQVTFYF